MASKKSAQGRRGASEVTRNLLDLTSSLSEPGDYVSEEAIRKRFGCSAEQAAKLYSMLVNVTSSGDGIVAYEDADGLAIDRGGAGGRALRLDATETFALVCALQRLGIPEGHPTREKLQGAVAAGGVDKGFLSRVLAQAPDEGTATALGTCSEAIAARADIACDYRKPGATAGEARVVRPVSLTQTDGTWYLNCVDVERGGKRTFRLDRMSETRCVPRAAGAADEGREGGRMVELTFTDQRFLDLFVWPGLELEGGGELRGTIPYFGGMWLPRQIAGCGGAVTTDDPELCSLIHSYVNDLIDLGAKAAPLE